MSDQETVPQDLQAFLEEVEAYAKRTGVKPNTVLYKAVQATSSAWDDWSSGKATPTYRTTQRVRHWMKLGL